MQDLIYPTQIDFIQNHLKRHYLPLNMLFAIDPHGTIGLLLSRW